MGQKQTTLRQWWMDLKFNQKLVNGPQVAIQLVNKDTKQTVLLFGESHCAEHKCGPNEESFVDLFHALIKSHKCDDLTMILELEPNPDSLVNDPKAGKYRMPSLYRLLKNNQALPECKINAIHVNLIDINKRAVTILSKTKTPDDHLIAAFDYMRSNINSIMYWFIERDDRIHKDLEYTILPRDTKKKLDDLFGDSIIRRAQNCITTLNTLTNNTPVSEIREAFGCAFNVGREMIDYYSLAIILNKTHNNILVYEGATHSLFIAAFLVKQFEYQVVDVAHTQSINCIQFLKTLDIEEAIDSIRLHNHAFIQQIKPGTFRRIDNT